jgi:D-xylose transport system ATP-binding protein
VNDDIILDIQHITKRFPGVTALDDVSVQIERGKIHGFCGENGAGKSTLMKILSGVYPHGDYEGTILYNGEELRLTGTSIRQAIEEGIAIVYQELTLVSSMNVGENIYLGKEPREFGVINWNKLYVDTKDLLDKYQLEVEPQDLVKNLGVGKMQMVEIAKALSEDAKILILDEPTSALTEVEIEKLMDILRTLKAHGVTCIYISHKLEEFFEITDTITVLRDGKAVTTQPTDTLTIEEMVRHMVGREMTERFPEGNRHPGEVILEVKNLTAVDPYNADRKVLSDVSFDLRRGEILGIAGLMGSGRTELVMTLFGEYGKITDGTILLGGEPIRPKNASSAIRNRISLVPEDRKGQGLVPIQSVLNNLSLPNLGQFASFMRIDHNAELRACLKQAQDLSIRTPNLETKCNTLSGGNQQKVVIAKWLMSSPQILIMDDPTRGIDVGAKYEIYKLMNDLAESGVAIIMISSELEEVIEMSDRIVVMWNGRSNGLLDSADATQERIMSLATGIAG